MINLNRALFTVICSLGPWFTGMIEAADPQVKGITLTAIPDSQGNCQYQRLRDVRIKAYRGGPIHRIPLSSDHNGDFLFDVPTGVPFSVLFFLDQNTVPEMQNLAADSGMAHQFSVALLTVKDYLVLEQQGRVPPLQKKLQAILNQMPAEGEETNLIRQMILAARPQFPLVNPPR